MNIGFTRSIADHESVNALLKKAGAKRIVCDSPENSSNSSLEKLIDKLDASDTLIVHQLEDLSCHIDSLLRTIEALNNKRIALVVLEDGIDTRSPGGYAALQAFLSLSAFQKRSHKRKIRQSLAEKKGAVGRPGALTTMQIEQITKRLQNAGTTIGELAKEYGVSQNTIRRAYRRALVEGL